MRQLKRTLAFGRFSDLPDRLEFGQHARTQKLGELHKRGLSLTTTERFFSETTDCLCRRASKSAAFRRSCDASSRLRCQWALQPTTFGWSCPTHFLQYGTTNDSISPCQNSGCCLEPLAHPSHDGSIRSDFHLNVPHALTATMSCCSI